MCRGRVRTPALSVSLFPCLNLRSLSLSLSAPPPSSLTLSLSHAPKTTQSGPRSGLAQILLLWIDSTFYEEREKAEEHFNRGISLFPRSSLLLYLGGYLARKSGEIERAIERFKLAKEASSDVPSLAVCINYCTLSLLLSLSAFLLLSLSLFHSLSLSLPPLFLSLLVFPASRPSFFF